MRRMRRGLNAFSEWVNGPSSYQCEALNRKFAALARERRHAWYRRAGFMVGVMAVAFLVSGMAYVDEYHLAHVVGRGDEYLGYDMGLPFVELAIALGALSLYICAFAQKLWHLARAFSLPLSRLRSG